MQHRCQRTGPLTRNGTNQQQRATAALNTEYFRPDERTAADLVQFAERFAAQLRYYDASNSANGDWSPFFATDATAVLAGLALLPVGSFQKFSLDLTAYLLVDENRSKADLSAHFKLVFYLPLLLLEETAGRCRQLPAAHPMVSFAEQVFRRDVEPALVNVIGYYRGAIALADPPLSDTPIFDDAPPDPADYNTTFADDGRVQLPSSVSDRIAAATAIGELKMDGQLIQSFAATGWANFVADIVPDTQPYEDSIGGGPHPMYHQIYDALNYNILAQSIQRLFQALTRVTEAAGAELEQSLTDDDGHTPHYGLFLTFLRLFRFNQQQLNGLTARHLNYYYREVLGLRSRVAQPDHVHLIVTPVKGVDENLLTAAETFFNAGKDALGNAVTYQLDRDFVVNRATIASLKSFSHTAKLTPDGAIQKTPFAATMTDSSDGQGEPLDKTEPKFKPFGPPTTHARVGFAVADRQLFVREGIRMLGIFAAAATVSDQLLDSSLFKISLTTDEGWFVVTDPARLTVGSISGQGFFLIVQLDADDPAITSFDDSVHDERFDVDTPVMKVEIDFSKSPDAAAELYTTLVDFQFTNMTVCSRASGVRGFSIQNEFGTLDPVKPFLPFGPAPKPGAALIVGCNEAFSKDLQELRLSFKWEQSYSSSGFFRKQSASKHTVAVQHLVSGAWRQPETVKPGLFGSGTQRNIQIAGLSSLGPKVPHADEDAPFTTQSANGFVRLQLQSDFGHAEYPGENTKALIKLSGGAASWTPNTERYNYEFSDSTPGFVASAKMTGKVADVELHIGEPQLPKEPYTAKIVEMSLSYESAPVTPSTVFHLFPFGHASAPPDNARLMPDLPNEGELYIGVQDLQPPQKLSILFQTADGTANPLKNETQLNWSCLVGNQWQVLKDQHVDDGTNNFTSSGIVEIAVPKKADAKHTLLPSSLHWFRVSAASDIDAVNDLRAVTAQAVAATFVDANNDPYFLRSALPAGTISKLKSSVAAIKKIAQPFDSFGGKPAEDGSHFYIRASERLRHKNRAATIWDYEHLVLEQFPHVYRVKCINHTQLIRDLANNVLADNEVKPGHVLVVPVPDLKTRRASDPLRPYTDKKTLIAIDRFLRERISPFVSLEVQNPKIEEVRVQFHVAFTDDIADTNFYRELLRTAIISFLTPWASSEGVEITFGGRWHKSAIINFVEEQSYVDYVKDFEMYHKPEIEQSDAATPWQDIDMVTATTARSILVSHRDHTITPIT